MNPAADVLALASAEFSTDNIAMGTTITVKWRGKPIFIRRRTEAEIAKEVAVNVSELRHPETDQERASDPEW
jgi:ubiquinol-cytochrome c reductase iron-sulfur subunit